MSELESVADSDSDAASEAAVLSVVLSESVVPSVVLSVSEVLPEILLPIALLRSLIFCSMRVFSEPSAGVGWKLFTVLSEEIEHGTIVFVVLVSSLLVLKVKVGWKITVSRSVGYRSPP